MSLILIATPRGDAPRCAGSLLRTTHQGHAGGGLRAETPKAPVPPHHTPGRTTHVSAHAPFAVQSFKAIETAVQTRGVGLFSDSLQHRTEEPLIAPDYHRFVF